MKNKKIIIIINMIIILLVLSLIGFSYSYFNLSIDTTGNNVQVTLGKLSIIYNDGNTISNNSMYPGDIEQKIFTITNNGTLDAYYNISMINLTNTFINNELTVSLNCSNYSDYNGSKTYISSCNGLNETPILTSSQVLLESIEIPEGITKEYTLIIKFIETSSIRNSNMGAHFNTTISVSEGEYADNKLLSKMISNDTPYSDIISSPKVTNSKIAYGSISSDTNGNGLYYTEDASKSDENNDGVTSRIYFYRGNIENNYVLFAGFCWRIVRTNEDGSIKLRYGGVYNNGECIQTGNNVQISTSTWYVNANDNADAGYMIGTEGASSFTTTHTNSTNSYVKNVVDAWYSSNILTKGEYVTQKIANTIYCNDRTPGVSGTVGGVVFTDNNYGTNNTLFAVTRRLAIGSDTGTGYNSSSYDLRADPTYVCSNSNDQFTLSVENGGTNGYGNNKLTYPIALLTADELVFAGAEYAISNNSYFLNTTESYWLMSPMRVATDNSRTFASKANGQLNVQIGTGRIGVVPAISLIKDIKISGGNGTYNSPYIIDIS